jgi:hypothetical protein
MGQREDVAASLMRGDSRDGCARRKVADQVREAVINGSEPVALNSWQGQPQRAADAVLAQATAASAVVLASDLRAPDNGLLVRVEADGEVVADRRAARTPCTHDGCPGMEWHEGRPDGCGHPTITDGCQGRASLDWRPMAMVAAARKWLKDAPESYHVDQASLCLDDLADALQGWRARLANVERLLAYTDDTDELETVRSLIREAMTEIRAMIDGEGE